MPLIDAILSGLRSRHSKLGDLPILIHTVRRNMLDELFFSSNFSVSLVQVSSRTTHGVNMRPTLFTTTSTSNRSGPSLPPPSIATSICVQSVPTKRDSLERISSSLPRFMASQSTRSLKLASQTLIPAKFRPLSPLHSTVDGLESLEKACHGGRTSTLMIVSIYAPIYAHPSYCVSESIVQPPQSCSSYVLF